MSRLYAAGIELRQGKPLPSLETIDSSSYYFDPVTQRPYLLRIEGVMAPAIGTKPGHVILSICRPIQQSGIIKNGKTIKVEGRAMFTIVLPSNHPGLERIPRM